MKVFQHFAFVVAMFGGCIAVSAADPIPIKDFARRPEITSVALSPDGRFI